MNIVETLTESSSQLFDIDDEIKRMASESFKWDCKDDFGDKDKCIQQLEKEKAELMEALEKSNKTSSIYIDFQKIELNKCNTALEEKDKVIKDLQETLKCQQCKMNEIQDQNVTLTNQIKETEHLLKSYEFDMKSIKDLANQNDNEKQHYRHQVIERDEKIKELSHAISNYKNISFDVNYLQSELLEKDRIIKELEDELQIRNKPCTQTNDCAQQLIELQCKLKECRCKLIESNKENFTLMQELNKSLSNENKLKIAHEKELHRNEQNEIKLTNLTKELNKKNNIIKCCEQFKLETEPKIRKLIAELGKTKFCNRLNFFRQCNKIGLR